MSMFTYSKTVVAGTRLRSLLTDALYVVAVDYDPDDLRRNATVVLALDGDRSQIFAITADRVEQDFKFEPVC